MSHTQKTIPIKNAEQLDHFAEDNTPKNNEPLGAIYPALINEDGKMCGYVHSVETGAAVDGPGVRFALFTSGCQFRCLYCHNPDTWKLRNGTIRTVDDIVAEIGKYAKFFKIAGGVTFTGGEPLMQAHFVGEIMQHIKSEYDLHIALDTQGFLAPHLDDSWFTPVDMALLDIKHIDPDKHMALTAQPLQPTLDFAERMLRLKKKMWIRYVLVPGWTDDLKDIEKHADYVKSLADKAEQIAPGANLIERVEILPFHKMGENKWKELDIEYKLTDTPAASLESAEQVREIYRKRGIFTC